MRATMSRWTLAAWMLPFLLSATPVWGANEGLSPCRYDNEKALVDDMTRVWRRLSTQMAILRQVPSRSTWEPFPSEGFEELDVNGTFRFDMKGINVRDTWLSGSDLVQ
ncbi:MAG TPA: hypothetical protein VEU33_13475, partial [Archangium sp.]|nr:hypothetical protein [Archangium sp.]